MGFIPKLARSGVFGLAGLLLGKKKKPVAQRHYPLEMETEADIAAQDALRRRRGAAADILTGVRGGEPNPASLGRLVVGS